MEYIYNLIPQEEQPQESSFKYKSVHADKVRKDYQATKSPGKLFGSGSAKPEPKNFTKKGAGETLRKKAAATRDASINFEPTVLVPAAQPRLSKDTLKYVPRHTEKPTMAPKSNKNFIQANKADATRRTTTKSTPKAIHTRGEVPKYLTKRKLETRKANEMADVLRQDQRNAQNQYHQISAQEREDILNGLKDNHRELYTAYLGLSVVVDTIPKRNKKNSMEAKLAELEADIAKLERHEVILVHE